MDSPINKGGQPYSSQIMPPKLIKALQSFISIKQKIQNGSNLTASASQDHLLRESSTSSPITKGKKK
jgi:hypothetical protein